MIRILHYGLTSSLGGIETYLNKLYTHIDKSKFHFDFLIIGNRIPCYYEKFKSMGSNFYFITPRSKNPYKNRKEINKLLKKEKFDIVHCHLNTLSYVEPVNSAIRNNISVIVHSRNGNAPKSFITKFLHYTNYFLLPHSKIYKIAVSDLAGDWLFGKKADYKVINNGINIDKYKFNVEKRIKVRNELNLNNKFVILNVGALRPQKNHMFILEIFKNILEKRQDARLLLVGDGKLRNDILCKIRDLKLENAVQLLGQVDDVSSILSAADIFLFPSLYEGFPNAVIEAQTSGLPCLISNTITNEVVITPNCVSLNLNTHAKIWAEKLLEMDYRIDREMGAKLVKQKGFSVENEINKVQEIYEELILN